MTSLRVPGVLAFLWSVSSATAQVPSLDFSRDVRPILNKRCAECHGGVKQKGGLTLTNRVQALAGGDSGRPLAVAGDPDASELFRRLTHPDPDERMPPREPLPEAEVETLRAWIASGAEWPSHWAYRPVIGLPTPAVQNPAWPRQALDHHVLADLERNGVTPAGDAPPHVLLRRLHLDLVGLPPNLEELARFEEQWSQDPEACLEATVDRLLASPHFGERWARHWLDQARYADSDGYEKDNARPTAWLWRDWVIDAINRDMPFDQFTASQLAGDLLPEATSDQRLATALHRQTLWNREGGVDPEEDRVKRVLDRVASTARTWMGITLECAQCHDHPYDPISQREFYQFFAFFNGFEAASMQVPNPNGGRKLEAHLMKGNEERKTFLFTRGDFLQPDHDAGEIPPGTPGFLPPLEADRPTRLDLAHWLTNPGHPLTARVTANTIWLHLFGKGLSRTPENFGSQGQPPSNPALLDCLATELMRSGWSRKHLIRTIVLSRTYRQASTRRPELAAGDPDNRLWHRQNRRRVEAEIVRDLHLSTGGLLAHRIGGPSVFPPIPPDVAAQSYANNFKWEPSEGADRYRRGMYTFFKRTAPDPNLMTFDCPDSNSSVTQRNVSNTPLMALTTLHNEVFHEATVAFAKRVIGHSDALDADARIDLAFRIALTRPPSDPERAILLDLLAANRHFYDSHPTEAKALAGASPDHDASELAAWIATIRIITNLDEFVTCN